MIVRRVFPQADDPIDLDQADARALLTELYRPPAGDWLRLNLIGSVSGSAIGADGTSESLTNAADRVLLNVIRSLSEVVLVGAATVRAEGYFVPRRAALAVVTGTGDLGGHRITTTGQRGPLLILCPASAVDRARETLGDTSAELIEVPADGNRLAVTDIMGALRSAGHRSIVCEGGPALAAQLVEAGVVDELCLSTSPVVNGSSAPLFGASEFAGRPLDLTQLLVDSASGIYARWRPTST